MIRGMSEINIAKAVQIAKSLKSGDPRVTIAKAAARQVARLIKAGVSRRQARRVVRQGVSDTQIALYQNVAPDSEQYIVTCEDRAYIFPGDTSMSYVLDVVQNFSHEKVIIQKAVDPDADTWA